MSELVPVLRSLASLHRAGVPWPDALASATRGRPHWRDAAETLARGGNMAEALDPYVAPLDRALLQAGEQTGTLESALEAIAQRHEDESRERGRSLTALAYPLLMGHVAALLAAVPDALQRNWGAALLWALGLLVPLWTLVILTRPRRAREGAPSGARAPRAGLLNRSAVQEADARALAALADAHDGGLGMPESLELAARAGRGGRVAHDLHRALPRVRDGGDLASAWRATPPALAEELRVAERAGELGLAARRIAARLRFDVSMRRQRFAAVAPIVMLLAVGLVVALRVIGFYTRLYANLPGM